MQYLLTLQVFKIYMHAVPLQDEIYYSNCYLDLRNGHLEGLCCIKMII